MNDHGGSLGPATLVGGVDSSNAPEESTSVTIRFAKAGDIAALWDAIRDANEELTDEYGTSNSAEFLCTLAQIHYEYVFIAVANDELVGYCLWVPSSTPGEVVGAGTWVDPDYRGHQISKRLRESAIGYWRKHGGKYVTGSVAMDNTVGRESIKRYGFQEVEIGVRKEL